MKSPLLIINFIGIAPLIKVIESSYNIICGTELTTVTFVLF